MGIDRVKVRARITMGSIVAITPYTEGNHILSFNVNKTRGQISTCSAQIKVKQENVGSSLAGGEIEIEAGENSPANKIFTGIVKSINITPCRDDPSFVILNVSAQDILSRLEGKKYTRRCRASRGTWVEITDVQREGLKAGKLAYTEKDPSLEVIPGDVEKKDNVTSTRSLNLPIDGVDKIPQDSLPRKVVFDTEHVSD